MHLSFATQFRLYNTIGRAESIFAYRLRLLIFLEASALKLAKVLTIKAVTRIFQIEASDI